jgi:6-phosphogluconolactonase (cycloisomerase 2 family)
MSLDQDNQRLFVAEYYNNRVTVFDVSAISNGENAVNVLGQSSFTTSTSATSINTMDNPYAVAYSKLAQRLFVSEASPDRITVFDVTAITDGENAVNVLGQLNFTTSSSNITQSKLYTPRGLALDVANDRLYVVDQYNNRVLAFNVSTTTITDGQNAENIVGQTDGAGNGVYTTRNGFDGAPLYGMDSPYDVVVDTTAHRLFVSDYLSMRVLAYNLDSSNVMTDATPDNVLGQPNYTEIRDRGALRDSNSGPTGLAFDSVRNYLFVSNYGRSRVMVFDVVSITDGENAINVLGQANFTGASAAATAAGMSGPYDVEYDASSQKLYVADTNNHRVTVYDLASITDGENAVNVLGQSNFTTNTYPTPPTAASLRSPYGVELDDDRLFVIDQYNHRVLVFDVASITDGENAVNVLGQNVFTTRTAATTAKGMTYPRMGVIDSETNRLFVSDSDNHRVMVYDVASVTDGENAVNVLGQSNFTSAVAGTSSSGLYNPRGLYFDSTLKRLIVSDTGNSRIIIQSVAPIGQVFDGGTSVVGASAGLSQGGAVWGDFDMDGDLDMVVSGTDGSNNQIQVYDSNGNGTFNSTAVNVAAANSGLKDGDVVWGDFDADGDLDVLTNGYDGSNRQLRVYKNNGNGTFNTTAVEVPGLANVGLSTGAVACGDFDNDGDLDVLAGGYDGTNNQLQVYKNNGTATFDGTAIDVAGSSNGLRAGSVAWGDFDLDSDLDVLITGTDGTNRQLRVYANNGNGTFNATATNVAGSNNGLSDGRVAWGDFDKDADLDVLVSGSDGTNYQLRTYSNNGNGTFNATATNVVGSNGGVSNSAVAVGDFNVDGHIDVLAAGRPDSLLAYWKLDENSGTSAFDLSGNAYTFTLQDGPTWADGKYSKAVLFDGLNDVLISATSDPFEYRGGAFSYSVWFYSDSGDSGTSYILSKPWSSSGRYNYRLSFTSTDKLTAYVGSETSLTCSDPSAFTTNQWNHATVTLSASSVMRLYVNSVEVCTADYSSISTWVPTTGGDGNSKLVLGSIYNYGTGWAGNTAYSFQGMIDDVRIFNKTLSAREVAGLYNATKASIGTLRIHKGNGNGTFNTATVDVDNGLERGNVAWGDADVDGDLDILTSGSDGSTPQLSVYLSTQSLTASNTAPSAPGGHSASFSFNPTGVSVASLTWTAGTDSGTGSTPENALGYDIRISTKSDFSLLMAPGEQGASPRMGSYLRPPKIFNGNTAYGVVLKSTDVWNAPSTASYGLRIDTTYYYQVKTVDAGLATSGWSASGTLNTGVSPSSSTLSATAGLEQVQISWNSGGDDGMIGNLTGTYRIQYATYTPTWSTSSTPTDATTVSISTTNAVPGSAETHIVTGLTPGVTYYFVLWAGDDIPNWSTISNATSAVPTGLFDPAQIELDGENGGLRYGKVAWGDFDNDGDVDVLANGGSAYELRVYENNGNGTFDSSQIDVDGAGGGLKDGSVAWGDCDNDGDLDILTAGQTSAGSQLRVYKNNGNGTFDPIQDEVDGLNSGLSFSGTDWGDFDNDGDLDVLANGWLDSNAQLRIYKNNGNGTFNPSQIEVESVNAGLYLGTAVWGDFENDGDLDILSCGKSSGGHQLRIYKNNGDSTIDSAQIELDGVNNGLSNGAVVWGDFDNDADLDIAVVGYDGTNGQLRVYKNNGNATVDPSQLEVEAVNGGFRFGDSAWGDFDNDGDIDLLASGYDGSGRQLRVYKNNGNATMDSAQIEVDGLGGGLQEGGVAWGDFDDDGDADILASGYDGANDQLRVYKNNALETNTAPSPPAVLSGSWDYSATGLSTATFKWIPGADNGASPTPAEALTYRLDISTTNTFTGTYFVSGRWSSPGWGNYFRAPQKFDGNTTHGVALRYLPVTNTTYYFRLKTIDGGLKESAWSDTGTLYTLVASSIPSAVTDLSAGQYGEGQITLVWTAPLNIQSGPNAAYDIRYSTTGAITNDTEFNNAVPLAGEPVPSFPGDRQILALTSLEPLKTYYFALKSSNDNGTSSLDTVNPRPSTVASYFNSTQIEVAGINNGLSLGSVAWGDFDNDGDLDVLTNGEDTQVQVQLRIYRNNGNGSFNSSSIEVDGLNGGLNYGGSAWGDFDNDGDLDVLVNGKDPTNRQLRVYQNNGNGTLSQTEIAIDGANNGLSHGHVAWGDFDNDGDLDGLASGLDGTGNQLRIYKSNGNATFDAAQIEIAGLNNGLRYSHVAWGDYDNDQDMDILVSGSDSTEMQLRVYKNNGNGTFNGTPIDVDGLNGGLYGGQFSSNGAWADYDLDGDIDILVGGQDLAGGTQLRVYKNNGNGTIDENQIEVDGAAGGLKMTSVAWGDHDNDGDCDILTNGRNTSGVRQLRVYTNNGNGTLSTAQTEVESLNSGLQEGAVAWGDFDADGDLDILANGTSDVLNSQLRVYVNLSQNSNTTPSGPGTLLGSYSHNVQGVSVASFTWNAGTDSGTGATPENGLTYDIQISTVSNFASVIFPGQMGASPRMGSYLKPPKIFNSNTYYGVVLKSTDPWNAQTTASYGLRTDTTYYYRVKTVDSALAESGWSGSGTVSAHVSPTTSTLAAQASPNEGGVFLTWASSGDDGSIGNLTGTYRIQYATYTATWSTSTTPTNATTVTIATTTQLPGSAQSKLITGLTGGVTYYFVLWTADEVPNWSGISNESQAILNYYFDPVQIEVNGASGGYRYSHLGWGDFDGDADLDILVVGSDAGRQLRVYENNGNGTINDVEIEVDAINEGLRSGTAAWGDFDNDGDIDVLATGIDTLDNKQLRVYKNNGNKTFDGTQIEVAGVNGGLWTSAAAWGDYDNDGDLDVLASGSDGTQSQLRVYKNNGNATFNGTAVEVDGLNNGLSDGKVAWGDFDNDGDLDVLANGVATSGNQLRVYKNNGNGTINPTQMELAGVDGGNYQGGVLWGDYDGDGDLDVLSVGYTGSRRDLRIYKNNGNGTIDSAHIDVDGDGGGLRYSDVAWGDFDNDGDVDLGAQGTDNNSRRQFRVYKNNGNGTIDPAQIEIDGENGGLYVGALAWGDYDNDGDLDLITIGEDSTTNRKFRIYKNLTTTVNTVPTAPSTLTGGFTFDASGVSVASMTWNTGTDSGTGATPENVLTYDIQISTVSNFASVIFPGQRGATPRMGSYLKPPKIFNSNTYYGVVLKSTNPWNAQTTASYGLRTDTTYYYRVKTVDSALAESAWSGSGTVNTGAGPSTSTLAGAATANPGEVALTWESAGDDGMIGNLTGTYRIQYATYTASWSTSTTPTNATTVTIATTTQTPASAQAKLVTGLTGGLTYYFVLWTADEASNWSNISNATSAVPTSWFDPAQIEVDGAAGGGLKEGDVAWGDFDADGDLDILLNGTVDWPTYQLRIYKNNGNGTIDPVQIEVDGLNNGLGNGEVQWGDYDVDGDLDILVAGRTGSTGELRIYKNNGNGTISPTQIEVDGAGGGGYAGGTEWGDFDNDGDLDILINGYDTSYNRLRIYKNNGNGTINPTEIDVDGATVGGSSKVRWGDFDGDGDLDFMTPGMTIYKNNGNGTMNSIEYLFGGADSGLNGGGLAWGDFDNDGDLDVLASGTTSDQGRLRIYKNNGNGTLNSSEIMVDGAAGGLYSGDVAWGDFDNDGDLEILASGYASSAASSELRVYKNNGNATMDAVQQEVDGSNGGLNSSAVAAGDYDGDGDLDILVVGQASGSKELRVYKNSIVPANTTPSAPTTLSASFGYASSGVSVASFTWNAGTDSGTGATPENVLTYDIQISTVSNFASVIFPGQMGASPRMGSYLKPPKIFNSNTYYGVVLKSTDPWNAQTTASYGLRTDTTYYYRLKTVDSALAESGWSSNGSAYTGVVPSTSTLAAASTATAGEVVLTWNSAGDDGMNGNVTGTYRIQYATFTASWSASSTPTDATTVTIATTTQVSGSAQSKLITGLTGGLTYYFVLWTGDEVPNWSTISNSTSAVPIIPVRSLTIEGLSTLGFGLVNLGSQVVASTGVVIRNDGTVMNKYVLSASTQTVGSPWSVKDSTPAGPDAMVIYGLFDDDTAPVLGNFGVEDLIGTMETGSNSSVFSIDGSTTGASVPAGDPRKIWIRLDMPTTSRTEASQTIRIQITAQPP